MDRSHAILQSFQSLSISSTNIDFGPEFASNRTPEEFVTIVDQYLKHHHHTCDKLHRFSLYFCPFDMFLRHIEHWVEYAVSKRVEELELDFSMGSTPYTGELPDGAHPFRLPNCVFSCKSLTSLSLSHFEIFPPQYLTGSTGFGYLCSLSLSYVNIRDDTLHWVLASCCFLQSLSLKYCSSLDSIKISAQGLQLQKLFIVDCWNALEIVVHAPNLQTLIYSGEHAFSEKAINVPSLVDAFVSSICAEHSEPEHDYIRLISDLAHVKTLTVCTATLWRVEIYKEIDAEMLPILLHNLKELQLLMDSMCIEDLACIYSFFKLCPSPFIEKLFIQFPTIPEPPNHYCCVITTVEEPLGVVFSHLKMIKLNNFNGYCEAEMRLLRFLFERSVVLETLVLVAPRKPELKGSMGEEPTRTVPEGNLQNIAQLTILREQLALLPKASTLVNIILCENLEDDKSLNPTHTDYYYTF